MRKIKVEYNNAYRIVMKYKRRNSESLMFLYNNVNNLTIKLRKSYNSLYKRIRNSRNSLIVQLYYYNVLSPSQLFTLWYKSVFRYYSRFHFRLIVVRLNYYILYGPLLCMSDSN